MHPLVKARHPRRWTTHLWNPDDQDSGVQVDMHHASALGLRLERAPGAEVQILGKKIEPFWSFLDALDLTCSLRDFLRYLYAHGLLTHDLAPTVLSPTLYAFERLPAALTPEEVQGVLAHARQDRTPIGLRNYAILLLLATYGVRAGEVVRLRLDDIDWRTECFHVRQSKTGRATVLPLLAPVGEAILAYLREGRPTTEAREVFLRAHAPLHPFRQGSSLYSIVARRLAQAGIAPAGKRGPHTFRHARAISLLRASVPMKTIGDLLGHTVPAATAIYLKLATDDLRDVCLDVPTTGEDLP
jgi:integrase/recombinase XerD